MVYCGIACGIAIIICERKAFKHGVSGKPVRHRDGTTRNPGNNRMGLVGPLEGPYFIVLYHQTLDLRNKLVCEPSCLDPGSLAYELTGTGAGE